MEGHVQTSDMGSEGLTLLGRIKAALVDSEVMITTPEAYAIIGSLCRNMPVVGGEEVIRGLYGSDHRAMFLGRWLKWNTRS